MGQAKAQMPNFPEKLKRRLYPAVLHLFSLNDFHRVNIRTISRKAEISSGTIYKYFASKEDLLFTILEEKRDEIEIDIQTHIQGLDSAKEIFRKILWVTMDYYDRNPGVAITAFITVPTRTWMQQKTFKRQYLKEIFLQLTQRAKKRGEIDSPMGPRRFLDIYYMICYRLIFTWFYFGMKWKLVDAVFKDFEIFWKMFLPPDSIAKDPSVANSRDSIGKALRKSSSPRLR
jgi:AcrR family transcriptional regulator